MTGADPFVHLHVASGHSLRYGASHPHVLVERAADHGMDTLALTDRDGVYGAVRFAKACLRAGIRPVLGVDLAIEPTGLLATGTGARAPSPPRRTPARRTPARGGSFREPVDGAGPVDHGSAALPRITLLAGSKAGWAALCRLVSATHLRGERGKPVATLDLIGEHVTGHDVVVMLGPSSELGAAVTRRRDDLAGAVLHRWREVVDPADLVVELVSHRVAGSGPGSSTHAARLAGLADHHRVGVVLTNAVRYADPGDAPVVDVLDAVRRLVPLDLRHLDRRNTEGHLKQGKQMSQVAEEITRLAGLGRSSDAGDPLRLLAGTRRLADRLALDPRADLGLGEIHFPEFEVSRGAAGVGLTAEAVLRSRCEAGIAHRYGSGAGVRVEDRLEHELGMISGLGYASYFLTVADVCDLIRDMGVRVAARGSGAGSLVNYALGISGVEPLEHDLVMERFLSPRRQALPDIDVDVESARRLEVYEAILDRYTGARCACVAMMETYRVRHAIRDVGAALGMPGGEIDTIAKAFPHIRARDAHAALRELPELRASGLGEQRLALLFDLVARLDGLPRHIALHPCGVLLSDTTLLDRTPVEASHAGFPMSQFDKEDVEDLGLLKLDVLGIRMQSAMAHAVQEIERVEGVHVDIDDRSQVPLDDPATFEMIGRAKTLGCFQIESPGQRELVGKFGPETFADIITDISLFRPGPVKSDMVTPFLSARQGWQEPVYPHPDLEYTLRQTSGVVVFHEQVLEIIKTFGGCELDEADEWRRALGDRDGKVDAKAWFFPRALARGYAEPVVKQVWEILEAFASFGFCKAHAAAFALPTYQSAWLKAHHTAAFLSGVLTHDPGMYPKRLILDDARQFGIAVLGLDVNESGDVYRVERVGPRDEPPPKVLGADPRTAPGPGLPDARGYGIRVSLADVKGISDSEVSRIVAGQPYHSLTDFWHRARVSRPVVERLVLAGGFDGIYGIGAAVPVRRRGRVTRRDLLLQVLELDRWARTTARGGRSAGVHGAGAPGAASPSRSATGAADDTWVLAAAQSQAARPVREEPVQLAFELGDEPGEAEPSGLPEMTSSERVRAELEILGLDVSRHVVDFYTPMLRELGVVRSGQLLQQRSRSTLLVGGVKVATQTPPIRSGRRVVFLTLDDGTGPVDATFFEDVQGPYAATVFHSWLMVVRGEMRRTGPRGVSLRATGCWEMAELFEAWQREGIDGVHAMIEQVPEGFTASESAVQGAAASRSSRPVVAKPGDSSTVGTYESDVEEQALSGGGMGRRRVLVHASGFRQSPYADIKPAGEDATKVPTGSAPRKLWHSSPGSSGG
uniref:DNA polymerase III subunit alpha n=1 Tax=uncultured Nocardioidaceae bacterium TaxID=253824 RepID=A0A6J4M822_9ACTN|nr:MAG: Error-prone repair homolog of DNA polymerase III alpha subunit [uncultured Nocardioidaceae bacterium]